ELNSYAEMLFVACAGLLIAVGTALARPLSLVISLMAMMVALVTGAAYAFSQLNLLIDVTFPILAITSNYLSCIAFKLLVTDREGRLLRSVFSHYVAPAVLTEIENNPKALKLGGETRDVTVMFVDIQNFTPMGERLKPEELVRIVNSLLSVCSAGILSQGGTIDKFIGDAVMAFWNAPMLQADHQYLACRTALEIQTRIAKFNQDAANKTTLEPHGLWPVSVRIGLASGPAVVGNMGSLERFDYSVLGETVNLASRAEGLGKHVGYNIVVAGPLHKKTHDLALLSAGALRLRGKSQLTNIHIVCGNESLKASQAFNAAMQGYQKIITGLKNATKPNQNELVKQVTAQMPALTEFFSRLTTRAEDYRNAQ
ncbi:MAG: adenylate/guanylate cyclase domain-containing protein, partial [Alphaproteobacteria bacterium]|nr:adenylate/guanylate cyclase domain-containing protein [Alphaproteobacteria bacterium]